ncbi:MAG TPA: hypothetical protein VIW70_08575 [Rubrivivax sp.]
MKNLQEATERICELKGSLVALDALVTAMLRAMPLLGRGELPALFQSHAEVARTVLLNTPISEHTLAAFEHDVRRMGQMVGVQPAAAG